MFGVSLICHDDLWSILILLNVFLALVQDEELSASMLAATRPRCRELLKHGLANDIIRVVPLIGQCRD